ncbi:MAG: thiamine biosynthesis protein ThiS [Candidatus Fluviicola riflensis]|nr:MAG: thiamine biosynthesis protein ThiS [Candidatus Fluviicola riflensis]OGS77230.1 MAG: thiamine biosynthesis protein ThiS [Candidatus Fluviicola riflensis]OGS82165.1 MAG: thiamine biosynthesis protein ThiS [Fluviicola sp. RIFCSPHIGHO2_01_FULL_43_53]OGS87859.1 MAG: thiamine biosynthesis protein ThiS [Fluviicola sp. RIFCSPHIGHO2_12_FULL_43_24]
MQLKLNDQHIETLATSLHELLDENAFLHKSGIAVAINDRVIQRSQWADKQLNEHDVILVITAAAGG